jgi:hypothetical protein
VPLRSSMRSLRVVLTRVLEALRQSRDRRMRVRSMRAMGMDVVVFLGVGLTGEGHLG